MPERGGRDPLELIVTNCRIAVESRECACCAHQREFSPQSVGAAADAQFAARESAFGHLDRD